MTNWLDLSNNANTLSSIYLQGFLDVSGSVLNRNTNENLVIAGDVSFSNNLYVQKDVSLNNNVYINGDISWNPLNFPSNSIMVSSLQNIDGAITSHLIPDTNETHDLGSSSKRFKDLYLSNKTLNLGNSSISATDQNAINLPSGSTMNNSQIGGITIKGLVASESALTSLSGVSAGDTYIADDTQYGYIAKTDNADTLDDWLNIYSVEGVTGTTGPRGDIGDKSSNTGDKGDKGSSIGPTGEIGEKGDPYTGDAVTGPKGIQGDTGVTGPINLTNNVVISKSLFVENDVSLNKNVDTNGQAYVYSFVKDATLYGGSTDISSVMGQFPALGLNHSVSNANLWRSTYTKTVDSYTGNDMWKNGDYTVTCSDFNQHYGAYSNPENAFNHTTTDSQQNHKYHWSANGIIPINYTDNDGNTQTLTDSTMNQWIALELPIHVKVTSWTCYTRLHAGRNWHLLGRERKSGLIRDLHIGTQNYGLIDGNPSYKEQYITNNVSTDLFVDKLYFVFNGHLNNNTSVSISNINFTGEMVPTSKSGLIVDGNASFTGTIDMSSFNLSANVLSINQTELSLDDVSVSTNVNSNILVSTKNATNLLNMNVSENLTFDDNARLFVTTGAETHMNDELYVNKDTSLQKDLYVKGNIVSDGNINLSKYNNDYIIESNTSNYQVNTIETFEVKKNTNIANDTTISQNIFVDEDVSMNNGLFVKEDVIWDPTKLATNSIYNASLIGGGITGPTGIQGIKGDIGQKGGIGFQNLETVTGYRGSTGPKGVIGVKGEKNLTNIVGSQGDMGYPDPHENLTLNGTFRIDGNLAIQNDLSWTPATKITSNRIHPHCLSGYQSDMPDHAIALWSGSISNIPNGWTLCDGANNTPDLRSKFVIGHDSRDLSFNIDMSGASYLLDPVGTNNSERNAFFIGDISDNGSWVDANGNKNATDAYSDICFNLFYKLAYIIKNIDETDVSNSFTFGDYARFEGDLSFNYNTPNGIDLRSIIPTFNTNQTLENVTFNKDISINNTLTGNLYISADTININDTSLNVFTEKTNPINNIIVENKIRTGGNVNISPHDTTSVRSMNYEDSLNLSQNTFKSNRNEIDGNLLVNNTIKTKNKQEGVNLIIPLSANQNTQFKETNNSGKTIGRFNTLAMNGEGNIIVYGEKDINTLEYPKNEGKIIVRKQLPNGNWISYGNTITTHFCSVDINDEGNILAIGNKYAEDTSIFKEQVPYFNDGTNNTIKGSSILADITGDNIGRYVFNRQYTNYNIYQDGEVKIYIYNDSTNIWEPMNMGYTRYHSADGTKITKGQYYGQTGFNNGIEAKVGTIDPNYYTSLATSSSIVPFEPFQAFGNLVKLNKAGNRILIAPEGHGGYNVGKAGLYSFNGKSQVTGNYPFFANNGFYGASTAETLYRVAHVYEYDIIDKLWKQLGSPIVVWDGNCCGYNEWASSPFFHWESRHSSTAVEPKITYHVDHTLRSYDNHKANANSLGMRLASVIDENTLRNIKTYSGDDELFLGNSYNFSNGTWEANEVQYPSNSNISEQNDYSTFNNQMNQTVFYNSSNWENSKFGSHFKVGIMDLSFNKHLPTSNIVAVIHNISGTKLLSTVSRNAKKYAIYELYREYRENHVTTYNNPSFGVPNGTYIEPGHDIPFLYYTSTESYSESADDHFVVEYQKTEVYDVNGVPLPLNPFTDQKYIINGEEFPNISLVRGESYTFDLSHFDLSNNPFEIVYPQGVTYSGTQGTPGASAKFVVPNNAPNLIEYTRTNLVVENFVVGFAGPFYSMILKHNREYYSNKWIYHNNDIKDTITLVREGTYEFDLSDTNLQFYPFSIKDPANGSQYIDGMTGTGSHGTSGAKLTFIVPFDAPNTLEFGSGGIKWGTINIISRPVAGIFGGVFTIEAPATYHYTINGAHDPIFTLTRGQTYTFDLSDTILQNNKFFIKRSDGSVLTNGTTYIGSQGTPGASLTIIVPLEAPSRLEYENTTSSQYGHAGHINIIDPIHVGSFNIISNIKAPAETFVRRYTITSERHYFFVEILKTFDEHKEDASIIYSPTDSDAYNHPHLTNAFGKISDDSRGKPFRALQSLASIVDDTSFTEIKNALGNNNNESAFINCEYFVLNGSGWQVNLDTYPKYHLDDGKSVVGYNRRSTPSRINHSHDTTDYIIPKNLASTHPSKNEYSFNSNIIHDKWHHAEPKNIHYFNAAPAHVVNIYKDLVDGRIKVAGYTIGYNIENIPVQNGTTDFYRIPDRFIAGETYFFVYNTHDTAIQLYESTRGSDMGSELVALGNSGIYRWTVPTTHEDSTDVGINSWGTAAEGYHYYIGALQYSNHIKMRVTSSYNNTGTPKYRLTIKNNKLLLYNQNIHHHEGKAIYEEVQYPGAKKIVPNFPEGTQYYPGGREYSSNIIPEDITNTRGDGNLMFSGVEKLYVKIDSISFNDEGTIAAFGLTGVGQQDIFRRGMYRGAALVYRLKNKNVADTSFNFISRPLNNQYLRRGQLVPFHNPEELLSCWERIGVFNGANNIAQSTQTSVGFKYIGHFGSAVCLNGVGNILAISARDSTYYNSTVERPGWITTIGTNTRLTDENFSVTGTVSYSTATSDGVTDRSSWTVENGLGGVGETVRGGYVQVFQYANDSGDIITESNNPGSNDRWQQLGGTIKPQVSNERCGSGLAINKEGNILSVGGLVGYIEGPLSGGANHATHHTRYRPGIIRNFIFRHLNYDEANQMHLIVGRSESGKAHLGDSNNSYSTLFNLNIDQKHWIQIGKDTLDFLQYAGQYNGDNDIRVVNDGNTPGYTFIQGEKYRSKIANILYPLDYHHYKVEDKTIVESGNYHTTTISDGNYDYDDETMNKIHNYYGKWSVEDCNVVMNRSGTKFMTNTFIEKVTSLYPTYRDPSIRIIDINSTHFQNTSIRTNQNNTRLVINKNISRPSPTDADNDIEYTILDVSGNAEINQNISTKHYNSIRSITVDIGTNSGTNSSSSKTVSFSYGKTYSDVSKLAFNVNVYSAGTNDNKQIDATIYNYTTTGAKLLVEASSAESDKTWSYSLKATVVIFETTDFTPVAPVYDYGTLYRYPPAAVPVAGDNGTSSFRGELQNANYGNGIYKIYTRKSDFSWIDVTGSYYENRVKYLIDFDLVFGGRFTADTDIYFYYEFPDQIYIREIEIFYNTSSNCQVDVWKNETTFNINTHTHAFNTNWNNIYDGAIDYKINKFDPAIVTMDDHNYKSTNIRIRLYGGTEYIHPKLILFNVTF